ncbi:tryptophan halogenase family protein [Asticcacaulis biprosthecium]|uniref:tryptophan halogenase family protein n=1 Tax=Asticcacaulis biprosthecium TaxID=76891 RepID=UPI0003117D6F|nr:tryptophan halogenase family protein [Asticcacaulis biprosthecium]
MVKHPGKAVRKVVIAGGGTAGWMCAAWFSKILRDDIEEIVLVESEEIGTVGVGEATTPYIRVFNHHLGIDEDAFVRDTQGTFKLGIEFEDWGRLGHTYHHPFGANGREFGSLPFHAIWLRDVLERGGPSDLGLYNLQSVAARNGKFMRPQGQNSPLAGIEYAFHFDAGLYAMTLRHFAEARGVTRIEGRIETVELSGTGSISALLLNEARRIEGDLFIDCTGFRALLLGEALQTGFEDWSHWLPCDRAYAAPTARVGAPCPYTRSMAMAAGWQWRIPLQHRDGNGLVFASHFLPEAEALDIFLGNLLASRMSDPKLIRFKTGRRKVSWHKNCVAIGLAAGFLEPLESTSIMLIQNGIARLQYYFPDTGFDQADIDAYNRAMNREYEDIRDFLILHYHASERDDSEFWRYCRAMPVPESLAHRLDLFRSRGRIPEERGEQFRLNSWLAVMWGQGLRPRSADPLTLSLDGDGLGTWLSDIRDVIGKCSDIMPTHEDFILRHCRAAHLA